MVKSEFTNVDKSRRPLTIFSPKTREIKVFVCITVLGDL